jgi:hypothetical protein
MLMIRPLLLIKLFHQIEVNISAYHVAASCLLFWEKKDKGTLGTLF